MEVFHKWMKQAFMPGNDNSGWMLFFYAAFKSTEQPFNPAQFDGMFFGALNSQQKAVRFHIINVAEDYSHRSEEWNYEQHAGDSPDHAGSNQACNDKKRIDIDISAYNIGGENIIFNKLNYNKKQDYLESKNRAPYYKKGKGKWYQPSQQCAKIRYEIEQCCRYAQWNCIWNSDYPKPD